MKDLKALYAEWREVSEEMIADGIPGDVDCGYGENRQDFSNFAELDYVISFEDMLELERDYEK